MQYRRRREALLDWHADNSTAARLDGIAADNLIRRPIRPFYENVGLYESDDHVGDVLAEDDDRVDALERAEQFRALAFRCDRALGPLVAANRIVGIESDYQNVSKRARSLEVSDVPRMENVEHAIREDDPSAGGALAPHERLDVGIRQQPGDSRTIHLHRVSSPR